MASSTFSVYSQLLLLSMIIIMILHFDLSFVYITVHITSNVVAVVVGGGSTTTVLLEISHYQFHRHQRQRQFNSN